MLVQEESDIPKPALRPIYRLWRRLCVEGAPPLRADIRLDDLRSATPHALFLTVDRPHAGLKSIRFTKTGGGFVDAIGVNLTGKSVAEVLADLGGSPEFTACFGEYDRAVVERRCFYNEGVFPALQKDWLGYQRLVMPLGRGPEADGLFVLCDFSDERFSVRLPDSLIEA
jgi:hypothetical protein